MGSARDSQDLKEQALILLKAAGTWMSTHTTQIIVGGYVICLGFSLMVGLKFLREQKVEIENDQLKQAQNKLAREKIMRESSSAFAMLDESEDEQ